MMTDEQYISIQKRIKRTRACSFSLRYFSLESLLFVSCSACQGTLGAISLFLVPLISEV